MSEGILGNATGGFGFPKTYIITDSDGNELTGVYVESEVVFTATDNDVRAGMTYASDNGVSVGTKDIPIYRTTAGFELILPTSSFSIPLSQYDQYDYTVFQCMISLANMNDFDNSVETNMVSLKNGVYEVNSTLKLSDVSKNAETKSIDLNISNHSENYYIIYYFTYRQED